VNVGRWPFGATFQVTEMVAVHIPVDCVNRGCDCNHRYVDPNSYHPPLDEPDLPDGEKGVDWTWVDEDKKAWTYIDEKGRQYPCCEYHHDPEGFDVYEED